MALKSSGGVPHVTVPAVDDVTGAVVNVEVPVVSTLDAGTASDGSALPANFDSKGGTSVFTPNAGTATSKVETKVIGAVTYTRTTTFSPSADALVTKTTGDWIAS